MLEPFQYPFVQRGLLEILILAVPAGILGSWIVLRGLTFYSHAVGTAAFPGMVLAGGLGFSPLLGALGAATAFGTATAGLGGRRILGTGALTALTLSGFLALGVILASDVFASGAGTDQLLFGSLFLIGGDEIAIAALAAVATLAVNRVAGPRWLAAGFDPGEPVPAAGSPGREWLLLGLVALATAATLPVAGALLVGAIFVVPAATARLVTTRLASFQLVAVALAAAVGTVGLWASVELNAPPGPTISVLAVAIFCLVALGRRVTGGPA